MTHLRRASRAISDDERRARNRRYPSSVRRHSGTLAHLGVLLLDELAEFQRPALEALRQPLEDGELVVARAVGSVRFPARFQLIGTMNLCPCGARGDPGAHCSCSAQRLAHYRDKLSRALLDRFDLVVTIPRARALELQGGPGEASEGVRARVVGARMRLAAACPKRTAAADELLTRAVERLPLSGRGRAKVAGVARTIAALAAADEVLPEHVAEALAYRAPSELATP
ncbi:MAG: ATP-binding protein [Gaiellaceae bacterium]